VRDCLRALYLQTHFAEVRDQLPPTTLIRAQVEYLNFSFCVVLEANCLGGSG